MRTIYDDYIFLKTEDPAFFTGANTGNGFQGEYERIAKEWEKKRLWILKGGCGTGKSTLLRKIRADAAEEGHRCIQYLCSADPDSLDAVEIDDGYMILDGTAPHVWEMKYPGAVSEILYMGKYWKREKLEEERETIIRLSEEKSGAYRSGYAILAALSRLEEEQFAAVGAFLNGEKLNGFLGRLLKTVPKTERTGGVTVCRTWAITTKGLIRTDGLARQAETHWSVEDRFGTATHFFAFLKKQCEATGIPVVLSSHPINDRIVEAYIPPLSLHLSLGAPAPDKTICMSRFLQKELPAEKKGSVRLTSRCMVSLLADACQRFREAGTIHAELEAVYKNAMDFAQMNRDTGAIRRNIRKTITGQ